MVYDFRRSMVWPRLRWFTGVKVNPCKFGSTGIPILTHASRAFALIETHGKWEIQNKPCSKGKSILTEGLKDALFIRESTDAFR